MKITYLNDMGLAEVDLKVLGGKAGNLSRLSVAHFPVPAGFVLFEEQQHLEDAIQKIGGFPVAVRSSGSLEDMPDASFAGLYETILFVKSMDELYKAIHQCFESRHSERVQDYLKTKKIKFTPETLTMSVLVQKMINSRQAGVLFTMNPLNGKEEEMYLELCEGVGERLVSGHVTPTQIVYNWFDKTKTAETINSEGTQMDESHLEELIRQAVDIQAYFGSPQDIEWAVGDDHKLYILQSRPVTTFTPRTDTPELTNADFKDGGVSARVCTPFMYSVYREALKYSMGDYFKQIKLIPNDEHIQWIHYHYGRVYWNAEAVKEGLKKIPDFKEDDFDRDLGLQKDYGEQGPYKTPLNISTVVGAVPILIGLNKEYLDCINMIQLFRTRFEVQDERLKSDLKNLRKMDERDFSNWFMEVILFQLETEKNYFRTIYNNSNFQTEFKGFLKKAKGYEEGDEIDLMGELHGVSHLDVQSGLKELKKLMEFYGVDSQTYYGAREKFLKTHYHHGPAELDLTVARWGENKEWVDDLVRNYVESGSQSGKYLATFTRLSQSFSPLTRGKFKKLTERSREFLRLREEMRAFSTRAYYLLRLGMLEFSRRKSLSEIDGFMLDVLEVRGSLRNPEMGLPVTDMRKKYYDGYRSFKAPNDFGGQITQVKAIPGALKGLGCSPGVFEGTARVILDIHQTGNLNKDEILITLFTDPGWTPVLARVGGVITEVGGLLSHAAVIGREYGIPAILNLIDATKRISDGDRIRMNGKTGEVEILEKCSEG